MVVDALDRCAGHVIALDYDADDEDAFFAALASIFEEFVSVRRRVRRGEASRRARPLPSPVPLVVFLALDTRTSPPAAGEEYVGHEDVELDRKVKVDTAVARVHAYIASTFATADTLEAAALTAWYVQPYDRVALHNLLHLQHPQPRSRHPRVDPFASGVYNGLNWLVRALQTQAAVEGRATEAASDI